MIKLTEIAIQLLYEQQLKQSQTRQSRNYKINNQIAYYQGKIFFDNIYGKPLNQLNQSIDKTTLPTTSNILYALEILNSIGINDNAKILTIKEYTNSKSYWDDKINKIIYITLEKELIWVECGDCRVYNLYDADSLDKINEHIIALLCKKSSPTMTNPIK